MRKGSVNLCFYLWGITYWIRMSVPYNNWERFYHRFNLIFHGLVGGALLPFAFVFLETQKEFPDAPLITGMESMVIKMLLVALAGVLIFLAQTYRKGVIREVQALSDIREKLDLYLSKKLVQYGILEGAAMAGLLGLYLTKDQLFSFVFVIVLFVFSLVRPTFDRVSSETGIGPKDLQEWGSGSGEGQKE